MNHPLESKREEVRSDACLYVCIYGLDTEVSLGILADLSERGFKLSSEAAIETGIEYKLQIKNPYSATGDSYGEFSAKALWSTNPKEKVYRTGFNFISHSEEAKELFPRLQEAFKKATV